MNLAGRPRLCCSALLLQRQVAQGASRRVSVGAGQQPPVTMRARGPTEQAARVGDTGGVHKLKGRRRCAQGRRRRSRGTLCFERTLLLRLGTPTRRAATPPCPSSSRRSSGLGSCGRA